MACGRRFRLRLAADRFDTECEFWPNQIDVKEWLALELNYTPILSASMFRNQCSNSGSGSNNCSFQTESRSRETALFQPP